LKEIFGFENKKKEEVFPFFFLSQENKSNPASTARGARDSTGQILSIILRQKYPFCWKKML